MSHRVINVNSVNNLINSQIQIKYQNINGLSPFKLQTISAECLAHPTTIFCFAETWFTSGHSAARSSNQFICESSIYNYRDSGRQNGGLLVLTNPGLRAHVNVTHTGPYSCTIQISSVKISFVYLPPSLDIQTFSRLLHSLHTSDIIVGDINTQFGPRFGSKILGPRPRLEAIQNWCQDTSHNHLTPSHGITKLDHVFVRGNVVDDFRAEPGLVFSDHPVTLHVQLRFSGPQQMSQPPTRYRLKRLDFNHSHIFLQTSYDIISSKLNDLISSRVITVDELDELIAEFVHQAASISLGEYDAVVARSSPDLDLKRLQKASSHADAVRLFKRGCRLNTTNIESRHEQVSPLEDVEKFFTEIYQQPREDLQSNGDTVVPVGSSFRITEDECRKIIEKYPTYKSCGEDGIHTRILQSLSECNFLQHLTALFNLCLETGVTPKRWNVARSTPIPKHADARVINDFRPISLTVMFRRCFETFLLRRLAEECNDDFDRGQAGFRQGFGVMTQVAISHDRSKQRYIHRVFVDLKQAYDRTPIKTVLNLLQGRGVQAGIVSLVQSLFDGCSTRVNVNGSLTNYIKLERGLMQGSILSPFLFSVFIDPLARNLNDGFPVMEYPGLLFADDIQIVHQSLQVIQESLDKIDVWCMENGMEVNLKKCATTSKGRSFTLAGGIIEYAHSYRYLGVPTGSHGIQWDIMRDQRITNGTKILNWCRRFEASWAISVKLAIFKAFIRPSTEYGGVLIYKYFQPQQRAATLQPYESFLSEAIAWIGGLSQRYKSQVQMVLAIPSMSNRFSHLAAGLAESFQGSSIRNPVRRVMEWFTEKWWIQSLTKKCWNEHLLTDYRNHNQARPPDSQISLSRFLKKFALRQVQEVCPSLSRAISNSSRVGKGLGADGFVTLPLKSMQKFCLQWRANAFCHLKRCVCTERFTRGHYERCLDEFIDMKLDDALNLRRWDLVEQQMELLQMLEPYSRT